MGWYDRIGNVKVNNNGQSLGIGDYVLLICKQKEHRSTVPGKAGTFFITEYQVLQSTNPAHPQGSKGARVVRLDGRFPDSALADVKAEIAAACGLEPTGPEADAQITPAVADSATHVTQPFAGVVVMASVHSKPPGPNSAPGAKPFNKFTYHPVLENGVVKRLPVPAGMRLSDEAQGQGGLPSHQPQGYGVPAAPAPNGYGPQGGWQPPATAYFGATPQAPGYAPPVGAPGGYPQAPVASQPPAFPPMGWVAHPQSPIHFWKPALGGSSPALTEAELRAAMAAGRA